MPSRLIREGILTSERVDKLSVQAELFYRRLLSVVDDFGRYSADPRLLLSACYPLRSAVMCPSDVGHMVDECQACGLLNVYKSPDKPGVFLEVIDFNQRFRARSSKWPNNDGQMPVMCQSSARTVQRISALDGDGDGDGDGDDKHSCSTDVERDSDSWNKKAQTKHFDEHFWKVWPRRVAKAEALKSWLKRAKTTELAERIVEAVNQQLPRLTRDIQYCPYPAVWLNQERYNDEPEVPSEVNPKKSRVELQMEAI